VKPRAPSCPAAWEDIALSPRRSGVIAASKISDAATLRIPALVKGQEWKPPLYSCLPCERDRRGNRARRVCASTPASVGAYGAVRPQTARRHYMPRPSQFKQQRVNLIRTPLLNVSGGQAAVTLEWLAFQQDPPGPRPIKPDTVCIRRSNSGSGRGLYIYCVHRPFTPGFTSSRYWLDHLGKMRPKTGSGLPGPGGGTKERPFSSLLIRFLRRTTVVQNSEPSVASISEPAVQPSAWRTGAAGTAGFEFFSNESRGGAVRPSTVHYFPPLG